MAGGAAYNSSPTIDGTTFDVTELGQLSYGVMGWVDHFATWQRDMRKRVGANKIYGGSSDRQASLEDTAIHAPAESGQRLKAMVGHCPPRN